MATKSIVQFLVIGAIVIAVATWFFIYSWGRTDAEPINILPVDAAMIIEINDPGSVYEMLDNGNSVWQQLLQLNGVAKLATTINLLDTVLVENEEYLNLLKKSSFTIAFYSDTLSSINWVILSKIEYNPNIEGLKHALGTALGREYAILDIHGVNNSFKIVDAEKNVTSYFVFIDGVLAIASSIELMNRLSDTYKNPAARLTSNSSFMELKRSTRSKVSAKVYIQYKYMSRILAGLVNEENLKYTDWIGNFAGWTESDILIKNSEVILSGFTIAPENEQYLGSLIGQEPVKIKALNILPYNTNTLLWIGLEDFSSYFDKTDSKLKVDLISGRLNYDISKLINLVSDEVFFVSNAETAIAMENSSWFAFKTTNPSDAKSALSLIARNTGNKGPGKHNGVEIGKINDPAMIPDIFGSAFSIINKNYFTIIDDYVVFANSERSLINFAGYIETGKTLDLNDNFKDFSDNVSSSSNLFIYIVPGDITKRIDQYFNEESARKIQMHEKVVSSFHGLLFQLSSGSPLHFTSLYTSESDVSHEENLALWKVQLDADITAGPFLVSDHKTGKQNIIVFDTQNKMYLIDSDGKVLWDRKIDGLLLGDIHEMDYYKNRKIQYLFNTADNIYLIDRKGRNVTGYPKKLHSKATNGTVVFDYLKNRDYRLLVAQADKKVYNYAKDGKEIKGWKQPRMQNIVVAPVKRLLANSKDYIIVTDIDNNVKIVDRKGNNRIKISGNLDKGNNSDYYVNKTNGKGIIITTDKTGKLVYISSSGRLNYTDFGTFSPGHFFLYEDFNGDRSKDFIYIDGNELKVFDRFKKVLFSYSFGAEINIKPKFFNLGSKELVLGVVSETEKTIYLFDNKGNIIISKGLVGETPFTVGNITNNNKINLVSAAGSTLYNYRLK
jgi:hypothetical protein